MNECNFEGGQDTIFNTSLNEFDDYKLKQYWEK